MKAYDDSNIFAKILKGEIPCNKVYENDHVLAFMDIMPRGDGHAARHSQKRAPATSSTYCPKTSPRW